MHVHAVDHKDQAKKRCHCRPIAGHLAFGTVAQAGNALPLLSD
jgi:hypothetical protein